MIEPKRNLTDTLEVLKDFDGGNFLEKLNVALTEVAGGVMDQKAKGTVKLSFEMSAIGASAQVQVTHSIDYMMPTDFGTVQEKDKTSTVMQVHTGGKLSFEPENQMTMFPRKKQTHNQGEE